MVKVENLSEEERKEIGRASHLVEITEKMIPECETSGNDMFTTGFSILLESSYPIQVFPSLNKIRVKDKKYFDMAMKLARAYESSEESEFTVRKDYI